MCGKTSYQGKKTDLVKQRSQASAQGKSRLYHVYKGSQIAWENYKDVLRSYEEIRRAKTQLEFDLAAIVNDNKKVPINTLVAKGGSRRVSIVCEQQSTVMTQDEEKAKEINAFFASVFNIKTSCPLDTHLPEMEIGDGEISEACTVW